MLNEGRMMGYALQYKGDAVLARRLELLVIRSASLCVWYG